MNTAGKRTQNPKETEEKDWLGGVWPTEIDPSLGHTHALPCPPLCQNFSSNALQKMCGQNFWKHIFPTALSSAPPPKKERAKTSKKGRGAFSGLSFFCMCGSTIWSKDIPTNIAITNSVSGCPNARPVVTVTRTVKKKPTKFRPPINNYHWWRDRR